VHLAKHEQFTSASRFTEALRSAASLRHCITEFRVRKDFALSSAQSPARLLCSTQLRRARFV
jgi:hypothetical protein